MFCAMREIIGRQRLDVIGRELSACFGVDLHNKFAEPVINGMAVDRAVLHRSVRCFSVGVVILFVLLLVLLNFDLLSYSNLILISLIPICFVVRAYKIFAVYRIMNSFASEVFDFARIEEIINKSTSFRIFLSKLGVRPEFLKVKHVIASYYGFYSATDNERRARAMHTVQLAAGQRIQVQESYAKLLIAYIPLAKNIRKNFDIVADSHSGVLSGEDLERVYGELRRTGSN